MMQALQQKFEYSTFDLSRAVRKISATAWIASGVLFVAYLYFIGAITFSVVKQRALAQDTKQLISAASVEEMRYLVAQKSLTEEFASASGLVAAGTIAYTAPKTALAWNVGR
jgi:hypothetical protein